MASKKIFICSPLTAKQYQIMELAEAHGLSVLPTTSIQQDIAMAIDARMTARLGVDVYQSVAFNMKSVTCQIATCIFGTTHISDDQRKHRTWTFNTMQDLRASIAPILDSVSAVRAVGLTRPLKKPSERWIRVVAILIPKMEFSWVQVETCGTSKLYMNFMYCLIDEDGEIHPPKDPERREIELPPELLADVKVEVMKDLASMAQDGFDLSPSFFRQLGMEERAVAAPA